MEIWFKKDQVMAFRKVKPGVVFRMADGTIAMKIKSMTAVIPDNAVELRNGNTITVDVDENVTIKDVVLEIK